MNLQGQNGPPYNIHQCTSDAGWGSSAIMTLQYGTVSSHSMSNSPRRHLMGIYEAYDYVYSNVSGFANISNLPFPERRINVSRVSNGLQTNYELSV